MVFKLIAKFLVALVAVTSFSANSAPVTYNLTGTVVTPGDFFGETGTGSFSYDDIYITGSGLEYIDASSSLTVDFTIFGQTFTEVDDLDYTELGAPELILDDGTPVSFDFWISEIPELPFGTNTVDILQPGIVMIDTWNPANPDNFNLIPVEGGFEVDVFVETIPIPAAVWLFGSGLIGLIGVARRKKS